MDPAEKLLFDLENPQDVELLQDLLAEIGENSDVEGLSDDEEEIVIPEAEKNPLVRVGADSMSCHQEVRYEVNVDEEISVEEIAQMLADHEEPHAKSNILCLKCKVHLCINARRNCFSEFHARV